MDLVHDLCEEVKAIVAEGSFSVRAMAVETNHRIGETIATHPAYKKHKHGAGKIVKQVAKHAGKSEQHLYLCLKFYERFPQVSNAFQTLAPDSKHLAWRHVVAALGGREDRAECGHEDTYTLTLVCCRGCGVRRKEEDL